MADPLFTNNAYSTLASSITDVATSLTVTTGEGGRFPVVSGGNHFYATLIDTSNNLEIVRVTARTGDAMTIVRGQDNTAAQAYSASDRIELRPTAAAMEEIRDSERVPPDGSVTNAKLVANAVELDNMLAMAADGFIGNDSGGSAYPQHLTTTEATALLDAFVAPAGGGEELKGLVPAPTEGDQTTGKEKVLGAGGGFIRLGWQYVSEHDLTTEALGTDGYEIEGLSGWDMLKFHIFWIGSADGNITMQCGHSSTTWLTGASSYTWMNSGDRMNSGSNFSGQNEGDFNDVQIDLNVNPIDVSANVPFVSDLTFYNWQDTAKHRACRWKSSYFQTTDSNHEHVVGSGWVQDTTNALTAIRFDSSGGGTVTGTILVEGRIFG